MKDYTDGSVFWVVVIIAESSLWLANATLAGSNVAHAPTGLRRRRGRLAKDKVRAHHHDLYGSSPSAVGTSF
eukprot:UN3315